MTNSKNSDRYLILLEEIQGQVRLLAEAHEHSDTKIESLRADMNSMGERLERRFDRLEIKVDRNTNNIRELKVSVDRNSSDIHELKVAAAG